MQSPLKDPQLKILIFLFETGESTPIQDITKFSQCSKSESEYHCDMLREQGFIDSVSIPVYFEAFGQDSVCGFEINANGRKYIMENIKHDVD